MFDEVLMTLDYGTVPDRDKFLDVVQDGSFCMSLNGRDHRLMSEAVNVGIDSHLEAVRLDRGGESWEPPRTLDGEEVLRIGPLRNRKLDVVIRNRESVHTLVRRLVESDDEDSLSFASVILYAHGIEWI